MKPEFLKELTLKKLEETNPLIARLFAACYLDIEINAEEKWTVVNLKAPNAYTKETLMGRRVWTRVHNYLGEAIRQDFTLNFV